MAAWWFLSTLSFFSTGHESTFGSLHISAGFIGLDEFHFVLSGTMLALNTWSGPIVHTLAVGSIFDSGSGDTRQVQGSVETSVVGQATQARLVFATCSAVMLLFVMLCLLLLRHHLFLWAVFAPKYVFLSATHLVSLACLVAGEASEWCTECVCAVVRGPHKQDKLN